MRLPASALFVLLMACSAQPNDTERAWIDDLEGKIALPPGAGKLACYERYYAPIKLSELAGVSVPQDRLLLKGMYIVGNRAGVRWKTAVGDFPSIFDAGCSAIEVIYGTQDHRLLFPASCHPTVGGVRPEAVDPPVVC